MSTYNIHLCEELRKLFCGNPFLSVATCMNTVVIATVLSTSFRKSLCPATKKVAGYVIPSEILSVHPSVCLSLRQRPHHSCAPNSSYSFRPILFKLYRHFYDGLKVCILFFQNPEIIFYHFFFSFLT